MKRRFLLIVLAGILLVTLVPATAFAGEFPGNNWATYFNYTLCSGGLTLDLVAGQYTDVGSITVWEEDGYLYVQYSIDVPDISIIETDTHVATSFTDIPQNKNGNPKVGHFDYKLYYNPGEINPDPIQIPLDDEWECGTVLFIATHAALSNGETAWSGDEDEPEWPAVMTVAFEDLPLDAANDWDYNDWVTDFTAIFSYNTDNLLDQLEFAFTSQARGAAANHNQYLRFPAGTFSSSGEYTVKRYDKDGLLIASTPGSFASGAEFEFIIFESTQDVLPANSSFAANTFDGSGTQVGGYTNVVITFEDPFSFNVPDIETLGVHGEGLFFDPWLENTREPNPQHIHIGDPRTLLVPDNWQWPQERAPIWTAYETGITAGNPPTFTQNNWYTYTPNDYKWDPAVVAP